MTLHRPLQDLQIFREIADQTSEEFYLLRPTGTLAYVNEAAAKSLGYSVAEMCALGLADFAPQFDALLAHLFREPKSRTLPPFTTVHIARDGRLVHKEINTVYLRMDNEEYVCAFGHDITVRKELELATEASEQRYRALFESAGDAILVIEEGVIIDCNKKSRQMFRCDREQIVGKHPAQLSPPRQPDGRPSQQVADEHLKTAMTGQPLCFTWQHTRWDGSLFDTEVSLNGVEPLGKGVLFAIVRDVSQRHQTRQQLKIALDRGQSYLDVAGVMIVALDPNGSVLLINRKGCELLGYSEEEILGKDWFDSFLPVEEREKTRQVFQELLAGRLALTEYHRNPVLRKDGTLKLIAWHNTLLTDDGGRGVTGIICSGEDITERQKLEEQLSQAQKMEAIGRLSGGVAHDFNNILTTILGYSQLAQLGLDETHPLKESLATIYEAGQKAAALTRQLLAFSRHQVLEVKAVNLNDLVSNLMKMVRRLIGEDIEVNLDLGEEIGTVMADPGQLEQVIMNLAVNARDAMPCGGCLTITTRLDDLDEGFTRQREGLAPGPHLVLTLADTGTGMTNEVKERIFEPFFTTKPHGKGTGLGLSTVYGIVKQHNGHIAVYSEPQQGTTFRIYLPATQDLPAALQTDDEERPLPHGRECILVVDDEPSIRALLRATLAPLGYTVHLAGCGIEAVTLAATLPEPPALLITDVVMLGMGGRELAEIMTAKYPALKVLFMSGYGDDFLVQQGILHDRHAYQAKPIIPSRFAAKIRKVLDGNTD